MSKGIHKLNQSRTVNRIAVIGCGGTGSALLGGLPLLDQALKATGQPGLEVVVADGDLVSATNCVRQPFSQSEIGLHKSVVLVNRLNLFWNLRWRASTEYVTKKTDGKADIIISCVDTRAARRELVESPLFRACGYWCDVGNSAFTGQFVLGQPLNDRNRKTPERLPTVSDLFPEILVPLLDGKDELPSCSAVESLSKQEPYTNQTLAFHALALLARLLRDKEIDIHGGFMNLKSGRVTPIPINPDVWRRMRHEEFEITEAERASSPKSIGRGAAKKQKRPRATRRVKRLTPD